MNNYSLKLDFDSELITAELDYNSVAEELAYNVHFRNDIKQWCYQTLRGAVNLSIVSTVCPGFEIRFDDPNDLILFRLRWS